jgi:hypothetical protein
VQVEVDSNMGAARCAGLEFTMSLPTNGAGPAISWQSQVMHLTVQTSATLSMWTSLLSQTAGTATYMVHTSANFAGTVTLGVQAGTCAILLRNKTVTVAGSQTQTATVNATVSVATGVCGAGSTTPLTITGSGGGTTATAMTTLTTAPNAAVMTNPAPGTTILGGATTFSWSTVTGGAYTLSVGLSPGGTDYYSGTATSGVSVVVPADVPVVYATLTTLVGGVSQSTQSYTYGVNPSPSTAALVVASGTPIVLVPNNMQKVQRVYSFSSGDPRSIGSISTSVAGLAARLVGVTAPIGSAYGTATIEYQASSSVTTGVVATVTALTTMGAALAEWGGAETFDEPEIDVSPGEGTVGQTFSIGEDDGLEPEGNLVITGPNGFYLETDFSSSYDFTALAPGYYTAVLYVDDDEWEDSDGGETSSNSVTFAADSPPPAPTATVAINNTADTSDDITVLSPAQTIPATVTLNGASGSVHLSVSPAGRASIDQTTLNLTNGVPATVTITPLQVSQAANDVKITATFNGSQVGQGSLTIVSVTIPAITNADTPAGMPNRIPPTATTPIQITIAPDLTGSGQSITLAKSGNSSTNGDFTIDGNATEAILKTTTVNLSGTTQTAPTGGLGGGNAGNLMLVAQVRGQNAVQSLGFSVAAIPMNFTDTSPSVYVAKDSTNCGMQVLDGWASDSGVPGDLDQVQISELLQLENDATLTGIFQQVNATDVSGYQPATGFVSTDTHSVSCSLLAVPAVATMNDRQVSVFLDLRMGVIDIPMANSGFLISFALAPDGKGVGHLTVSKTGASETLNNVISGKVTLPVVTSGAGTTTPAVLSVTYP